MVSQSNQFELACLHPLGSSNRLSPYIEFGIHAAALDHIEKDCTKNRLLELLPHDDINKFRGYLEEVPFIYKLRLYNADQPMDYVYFPIEGVAPLVTTMKNGSAADVGTIGNEGIVGVPIVLGDITSPADVYVQVDGRTLRLKSDVFRKLMDESRPARAVLLHYVHAFINQVSQPQLAVLF